MYEEDWRSAKNDPPSSGQYVEIGRADHTGYVADLECLWWYPRDWNVDDMYWRPAEIPS
jgi:hypothetical protein